MNNPVDEILKMKTEERIKAATAIMESIASDLEDSPLTSLQLADLKDRIKTYEDGLLTFRSWTEVFDEVKGSKK